MNSEIAVNPEILDMMQCPVSGSRLEQADEQLLQQVNHSIESGNAITQTGESVAESIDGGLLNSDRSLLVPARGKIYCFNLESLIKISR